MRVLPLPELCRYREEFIVPVWTVVKAEGDDAQAAEERAWDIVALIEDAVLANPSLSNAQGVTAAWVAGKIPESHIADGARAVSIITNVAVRSKLT